MGVEIQLFECYALKKTLQRYEGKTNDVLIAFIGYVIDLNKLQQFKVSVQKIPPSISMNFSTFLANSTCSSLEVVLALLLYEGSTTHNASDQFVSCVYFFFVDRFSSIHTDKNLLSTRQLQTAVSPHPLKTGHVFI